MGVRHFIPRRVEEMVGIYQQALRTRYNTSDGQTRELGELSIEHLRSIAAKLRNSSNCGAAHIVEMVISYKVFNLPESPTDATK